MDKAETPSKSPQKAGLKPPWKKGDPSPNPKGHPLGQRNFQTIYKAALKKIAESQNMTPEEFEDLMLQSGLKNALKDYRFYKDTNDRLHGPPKQDLGIGGVEGGQPLEIRIRMV